MFSLCFGVQHPQVTSPYFSRKILSCTLWTPSSNLNLNAFSSKKFSIWLHTEIIPQLLDLTILTRPPPMKSVVAVLRALVLVATSQKIAIWALLKRKIKFSLVKTKNNSLQSYRQWKDAQVCRRWVHDSKIFHVFCTGLTQKTPILGYLSTSSHSDSKKKLWQAKKL